VSAQAAALVVSRANIVGRSQQRLIPDNQELFWDPVHKYLLMFELIEWDAQGLVKYFADQAIGNGASAAEAPPDGTESALGGRWFQGIVVRSAEGASEDEGVSGSRSALEPRAVVTRHEEFDDAPPADWALDGFPAASTRCAVLEGWQRIDHESGESQRVAMSLAQFGLPELSTSVIICCSCPLEGDDDSSEAQTVAVQAVAQCARSLRLCDPSILATAPDE
jgi:hypothetical protein